MNKLHKLLANNSSASGHTSLVYRETMHQRDSIQDQHSKLPPVVQCEIETREAVFRDFQFPFLPVKKTNWVKALNNQQKGFLSALSSTRHSLGFRRARRNGVAPQREKQFRNHQRGEVTVGAKINLVHRSNCPH